MRFGTYLNLLEGGNVDIDGNAAQSIDLSQHDRDKITQEILRSLREINRVFETFSGKKLWSEGLIRSRKFMSGSTLHLFNKEIPSDVFYQHKKKVGDIDVMVDEKLKDSLSDFLDHFKHKDIGSLMLFGYKSSAGTLISLWYLRGFGVNIQIDFELVDFDEEGNPTEWSRFARSSDWNDMTQGIKGAMHKLLMRSLMAKDRVDMLVKLKTKMRPETSSPYALSPAGLRQRYSDTGEVQDGKPVYAETKSSDYVRQIDKVFQHVFGHAPDEDDLRRFWNFGGMLDLIKENMSADHQKKIVWEFLNLLYGDDAQGLYKGDPARDKEEKQKAEDVIRSKGIPFDEKELKKLKKEYYARYK